MVTTPADALLAAVAQAEPEGYLPSALAERPRLDLLIRLGLVEREEETGGPYGVSRWRYRLTDAGKARLA